MVISRVACLALYLLCLPLHAAVIIVDSDIDGDIAIDGNCTLREALTAANFNVAYDQCAAGNSSGIDSILVLPSTTGATIEVGSLLPVIDEVEIVGPGRDKLVIQPAPGYNGHLIQVNMSESLTLKFTEFAGARDSVINIINIDTLEIDGSRFRDNQLAGVGYGGAIHARWDLLPNGETLSIDGLIIDDTEFLNNSVFNAGGAISHSFDTPVEIRNSVFIDNSGQSGGAIHLSRGPSQLIWQNETLIENVQFEGNSAFNGGTIFASERRLTISQSFFTESRSNSQNGSVMRLGTVLGEVINSTFLNNGVADDSTMIDITDGGASELLLEFNTFSNNTSRILKSESINALVISVSNIFDGSNSPNCSFVNLASLATSTFNIESNEETCALGANDFPMTDPMLLPAGIYGIVPFPTRPPRPLSPAVDMGGVSCPPTDNIGTTRPLNGDGQGGAQCDIGAIERAEARLLTLNVNGNGKVQQPDFNLVCDAGETCEWPLTFIFTFDLVPVPDAGHVFDGWTGACDGTGDCSVTMTVNRTVGASFSPIPGYIFGNGFDD